MYKTAKKYCTDVSNAYKEILLAFKSNGRVVQDNEDKINSDGSEAYQ